MARPPHTRNRKPKWHPAPAIQEKPMGLFDTIACRYLLPDPTHQDLEFQTKDLGCELRTFTITREGRLLDGSRERAFHGDVLMYGGDPRGSGLVEYTVRFTHGRVEWIRRGSVEEGDKTGLEVAEDGPIEKRSGL